MGFQYEPCPFCGGTEMKLYKVAENHGRVQCQKCKTNLVTKGGSLMDCARNWNTRAQRRTELAKHKMGELWGLYADIFDNPENHKELVLDNTDDNWGIVFGAETAWDQAAKPNRPEHEPLKISYQVIIDYLNALAEELAQEVTWGDGPN